MRVSVISMFESNQVQYCATVKLLNNVMIDLRWRK